MINTNYFQTKLEEERMTLEQELQKIGRRNPDNPNDWQTTRDENDQRAKDPDKNVVADSVEDFVNNKGIESALEIRLENVKNALTQIENGKYGVCAFCGEEIDPERLEANPAATTCKEHMDSE